MFSALEIVLIYPLFINVSALEIVLIYPLFINVSALEIVLIYPMLVMDIHTVMMEVMNLNLSAR